MSPYCAAITATRLQNLLLSPNQASAPFLTETPWPRPGPTVSVDLVPAGPRIRGSHSVCPFVTA